MNSNTSSIPYKPFSSPALYSINQKTTNDTPEYSGLSDIAVSEPFVILVTASDIFLCTMIKIRIYKCCIMLGNFLMFQ